MYYLGTWTLRDRGLSKYLYVISGAPYSRIIYPKTLFELLRPLKQNSTIDPL